MSSRGSTTLYVTGFGSATRARDLAYEFERFAFVEYESRRDADDAYHEMHNKSVGHGDLLKIEWARTPPSLSWRFDAGRERGPRRDRSPRRRSRSPPPRRRGDSPRKSDRRDRDYDRRDSRRDDRRDRDRDRDRDDRRDPDRDRSRSPDDRDRDMKDRDREEEREHIENGDSRKDSVPPIDDELDVAE